MTNLNDLRNINPKHLLCDRIFSLV